MTLRIEDDHVVAIEGDGVDADLFRSYLAAFGDRESYAVSHVGFGMNRQRALGLPRALRQGADQRHRGASVRGQLPLLDRANENAGRYTAGHFDLPMRGCTIALDDRCVVDAGVLQGELA